MILSSWTGGAVFIQLQDKEIKMNNMVMFVIVYVMQK
jgi:hypothetical protein